MTGSLGTLLEISFFQLLGLPGTGVRSSLQCQRCPGFQLKILSNDRLGCFHPHPASKIGWEGRVREGLLGMVINKVVYHIFCIVIHTAAFMHSFVEIKDVCSLELGGWRAANWQKSLLEEWAENFVCRSRSDLVALQLL